MFSSSCAVLATSADILRGLAESFSYTGITTINMLPDEVLLDVLKFVISEWQRLVHVCQRWRRIVFGSPRGLDLTILCTYGTPVKKNLACWPPFPIVIDFTWSGTGFPLTYEDDVTAALEHPDRVRSIKLAVTSLLAVEGRFGTVMQEPFLALTTLWLSLKDRNPSVLPDVFLSGSAPNLRQIHLVGISFPALPTILLSASNLVDLQLKEIPQGGYISPEAIVTSLAALTRLDTLCIWFKSPTSRLQPRYSPLSTREVLTSLISLNFRGCSEYLEHLLARIDTPRLHCFETTYFNQLDFRVPQLSQFISRTESLDLPHSRHARARIRISNLDVKLDFEGEEHSRSRLTLCIPCKSLDWQVSHLARILSQSLAMVSNVDDLSIDEVDLQLDQSLKDDVDWLELLRPFTAVTMLRGSKQFAGRIARALDGVSGEMANEVLPALVLLSLEDQPVSSVEQFVAVRQLSGHPIMFLDTKGVKSFAVLVDGFISRTFAPGDATNYLMLLLRTHRFLQHYRIVHHQGAWYITRNGNLVRRTSQGVPRQPTPLLDYCAWATHGTIVPQKRWTTADDVNFGRHIENAVLQLPIFFVNHDGSLGFRVPDILRGCDRELHNANSFAPLGGEYTTHVRIHVSLSLGY
jgi:hypothetical protein